MSATYGRQRVIAVFGDSCPVCAHSVNGAHATPSGRCEYCGVDCENRHWPDESVRRFEDFYAKKTRWQVYRQRDGYWRGLWIAQPPGADFESSYAFRSHRNALQYATEYAAVKP